MDRSLAGPAGKGEARRGASGLEIYHPEYQLVAIRNHAGQLYQNHSIGVGFQGTYQSYVLLEYFWAPEQFSVFSVPLMMNGKTYLLPHHILSQF